MPSTRDGALIHHFSLSFVLPPHFCFSHCLCFFFFFSVSWSHSLPLSLSLSISLGLLSVSLALYNALYLCLSLLLTPLSLFRSGPLGASPPHPTFPFPVLTFAFKEVLQELVRCAGVLQLPSNLGVMIERHRHIPGVPAHVNHLYVGVGERGEGVRYGQDPSP